MTFRSRRSGWIGGGNEYEAEQTNAAHQQAQIDAIRNPTPFEAAQSPAAIKAAYRALRTDLELLLGIYEARSNAEPHCEEFALQLRRILSGGS
jgi:hypothetical protein